MSLRAKDGVMGQFQWPRFADGRSSPDGEEGGGPQTRLDRRGDGTHLGSTPTFIAPRPLLPGRATTQFPAASLNPFCLFLTSPCLTRHYGCCTHQRAQARPQVRPLRLSHNCSHRSERTSWPHHARARCRCCPAADEPGAGRPHQESRHPHSCTVMAVVDVFFG